MAIRCIINAQMNAGNSFILRFTLTDSHYIWEVSCLCCKDSPLRNDVEITFKYTKSYFYSNVVV